MKVLSSFLASFVLVAAAVAPAQADHSRKVMCGAFHTPRTVANGGGLELLDSSLRIRNGNIAKQTPVRITRLTYLDMFGEIVHDSGEASATGAPLPLNTDVPGGLDIAVVPPGASYYLTTSHVFGQVIQPGLSPVAILPFPPSRGNMMTVVVEFTTQGEPDLVVVGSGFRGRQFFGPGVVGEERTREQLSCVDLKK